MTTDQTRTYSMSAYGGEGWQPRLRSLRDELGVHWAACGMDSEYARLQAILLHRPGDELSASTDPNAVNMLSSLDIERARSQHDQMAQTYRSVGVEVHYTQPHTAPTPNQMFMADVFVMTPEGAIIARPASEVRAGEERVAAQRLADLGVPIVRSIGGRGTFEGADLMWLDPRTAIIGRGLRTNDAGAAQVAAVLREMGCEAIIVDLPIGTMHLMGTLRIIDHDLAIVWPYRFAHRGIDALRERGYQIALLPDNPEVRTQNVFNFVTVGPREIVMAASCPITQGFYESLGIRCHATPVDELIKAAGAIGCLTGIVRREIIR